SVTGELMTLDATAFFNQFAGSTSSVIWLIIAMLTTVLIVKIGVAKGIEKLNKIAMPLLLILFIILIIRSVTLPGAEVGIEYLLKPRWEY
ncbi:sodium-dependent transporter, partial [Acinetobacter baumannii]